MPGLSIRASSSPIRIQAPLNPPTDDGDVALLSAEETADVSVTPRRCSPHRSRRDRHSRRRRRFRFMHKERNLLAAICSLLVVLMLGSALVEPDWFYLHGGGCKDGHGQHIHKLGVFQFFYAGHFEHEHDQLAYHYSSNRQDELLDCVTPRTVQVLQSIIALCFIGMMFTLVAFCLDVTGPTSQLLKVLRRNAVFNILTVVVCVTVNGFSFLVTQLIDRLQNETKSATSKVEVRFDVSFYLVAAAGALSVIAAACNLLRRYRNPYESSPPHLLHQRDALLPIHHRDPLLRSVDGLDCHPLTPDYYAPMSNLPPPPAYTP